MLTGGIDLGRRGRLDRRLPGVGARDRPRTPLAIAIALLVAVIAGLVTGVGVASSASTLIMTLGMSLVVFGLANAIQLLIVKTSSGVAPRSAGSARTRSAASFPTACWCSCRSPPRS